ncbi:hypothetical protein AX16_004244 [Volvariella volvacea WC 439]|nr:hypothetical protein AX16_004244 [Volvariella volvacea WC 439]
MSSNELLDVGAHCSLPSCNIQDFLPIICQCQRYFCRDHIQPDLHGCPASIAIDPKETRSPTSPRCALHTCNKLALNAFVLPSKFEGAEGIVTSPTVCTTCQLSFCVDHRHPISHSCTQRPTSNNTKPNEAARALLASHFPSASSSRSSIKSKPRTKAGKVPSDPVKLAQYKKVELMKMRHRAISADPKEKATVPLDQRLFVRLQVIDKPEPPVFWVRKTLITGKIIDILSVHAGFNTSAAGVSRVTSLNLLLQTAHS